MFTREQNIEVLEIPNAGHKVDQRRWEMEVLTTNVYNQERSEEEDEGEEIRSSTRLGTEGATLHQLGGRDQSGKSSPPGVYSPRRELDGFRHIDDETSTQYVQRLDEILTRLRNIEKLVNWSAKEPRTSKLADRLAALESSTNRSIP